MVCTLAVGWITDGEDWSHPRPLAIAALCVLAIALAATRNRRAYVAAIEERARRAEASREQDARRRVADERLRIARYLHAAHRADARRADSLSPRRSHSSHDDPRADRG